MPVVVLFSAFAPSVVLMHARVKEKDVDCSEERLNLLPHLFSLSPLSSVDQSRDSG